MNALLVDAITNLLNGKKMIEMTKHPATNTWTIKVVISK